MNNYIRHIISILALMTGLIAYANSNITGYVRLTDGHGVDFANVTVTPANEPKNILASTFTDDKGGFSLSVASGCDSLLLKASGMEINTTQIIIPNRSGEYIIISENKTVKLREVIVKSKKIYSNADTVNYNVSSFLSSNDRTIAEVLRKMPGISVSESGQVSYQGKPIKNFYIEGLDLMKGHYGIATNNIDPNNIATVQVFENHQDIKALKGIRPEEQASINLRLKEGVKGVFNLIANLGGGYGEKTLWNNSVLATYFRRNSQLLATYKGNNTGEDLSRELYSSDNDYSRTNNITSITMPSAPGIDKKFYYFNRSHSTTFNNVYRIGKSGEFGINAAYLNDRDSRESYSYTANILPDATQNTVSEFMNGTELMNKAYGDLTFMNNSDNSYLKEQLKFDWSKTYAVSNIMADSEKINQDGKTDIYRLLNKFHMTHRSSESKGFEVYSLFNAEKRPHNLSVSPNLFADLFAGNILNQSVNYRNISTENSFRFLSAFKYRNFNLHPTAMFNYHNNSLISNNDNTNNNLTLDYIDAGIDMEFVYSIRKLHASLHIPFKYKFHKLDNHLHHTVINKNGINVEPNFNLTYDINSNHHIKLISSLSHMTPSIENLYSNYILTSYRCLSVYDVTGLYEGMNLYSNVGYNFKNILSMSFAGVDLGWNRQMPDVIYGSYYDGIAQHTISRLTSETSNMLSAKFHASQGFDWRRLKIEASASYNHYAGPLLVQDEIIRYTGNSFSLNADFTLSPFNWLDVSYDCNYYQSSSRQEGYERMPWLRTFTNKAMLYFKIPGDISLKTSMYHYYNNFNHGNKSFMLLNAEAVYSIKRLNFTLSYDNILNSKTYVYSSREALKESCSIYNIRPRSAMLKIRFRIF